MSQTSPNQSTPAPSARGKHAKPRVTARGLGLALARIATVAIVTAIIVACIMIVGAISAYAYFAQALPPPDRLAGYSPAQSTKIYDRNGELLFEVFDPNAGKRTVVPSKKNARRPAPASAPRPASEQTWGSSSDRPFNSWDTTLGTPRRVPRAL
jgi:hypothetical protein